MEKDKEEEEESSKKTDKEKVAKFLGTEKSITTKRANPFVTKSDESQPSGSGGPPTNKKRKEDEANGESIINTSE